LRQLNNNPLYSKGYVTGGKRSAQGNGEKKVPRLIVEFTVENKAKAKQQADRRARQLENASNQKLAKSKKDNSKDNRSSSKKKLSRGALQREKKRKKREEGNNEELIVPSQEIQEGKSKSGDKPKVKMSRPVKRQKVDKEEKAFESMVEKYKSKFMGNMVQGDKKSKKEDSKDKGKVVKQRWFE